MPGFIKRESIRSLGKVKVKFFFLHYCFSISQKVLKNRPANSRVLGALIMNKNAPYDIMEE